jgi:hypothetical protein
MTNTIANQLLLSGVDELFNKNKIDIETKKSLDKYVCENQGQYFSELKFTDFDQLNSLGVTFDPTNRIATNSTTCTLQTNIITNLNGRIIKGFKTVAQTPVEIVYQMSYDKVNWFNISADNAWEEVGIPSGNRGCSNHYHGEYDSQNNDGGWQQNTSYSNFGNYPTSMFGFYLRLSYITANVVSEIDILYV